LREELVYLSNLESTELNNNPKTGCSKNSLKTPLQLIVKHLFYTGV